MDVDQRGLEGAEQRDEAPGAQIFGGRERRRPRDAQATARRGDAGVGAGEPGQRAMDMLKIDRPTLDWVALAKGMGVAGRAVTNADEFVNALADGIADQGPRLIEVRM